MINRESVNSIKKLEDLPEEILLEIIGNMLPEEILLLKKVSLNFRRLAGDPILWKKMLQMHFPHIAKNLKNKTIDWPLQFKDVYLDQYRNIEKNKRILFSIAKQGRIVPLKGVTSDDMGELEDKENESSCDWAAVKKNQHVLNHFFTTLILPYYKKDGHAIDYRQRENFFFEAARYGQIDWITAAISSGTININLAIPNGTTLLYTASYGGHQHIVKKLLAAGADVNQAAGNSCTPIRGAAHQGHLETVKMLLAAGAEVDRSLALYVASYNGHEEIVKILLASGANVNQSNADGATSLFGAARRGHLETVKILIASGANVNHANEDEVTSLFVAAREGQFKIVNILLAAGAEVDKATNRGATPLFTAAGCGYLEIVKILTAAGAEVDKATNSGATPLYIAAQEGHLETVKTLITANANVNKTFDGDSALTIAVHRGHAEIAKILLNANTIIRDDKRLQLLNTAQNNNMNDLVITLLKIYVLNYIKRKLEISLPHSFRLFHVEPNTEYRLSIDECINAAKALLAVLEGEANSDILTEHYQIISRFKILHQDEIVILFDHYFQAAQKIYSSCKIGGAAMLF